MSYQHMFFHLFCILPLFNQVYNLEVRIADVLKTNFIDQLEENKYVVAIRSKEEIERLADNADEGSTAVVMTDKTGVQYRCFLPPLDKNGEDESEDLQEDPLPPSQYLSALNTACFYRIEGWWTYEVCYQGKIRQYHQEKDRIESEFSLGEYDEQASAQLEDVSAEAEPPYFAQKYTGGTPCDITNTPRETEVRFICSSDHTNVLTSIKEPSTCSYTMTFSTPLLCKHPSFKKKEASSTPIYCNPLIPDEDPGAPQTGADAPAPPPVLGGHATPESEPEGEGGDSGGSGSSGDPPSAGEAEGEDLAGPPTLDTMVEEIISAALRAAREKREAGEEGEEGTAGAAEAPEGVDGGGDGPAAPAAGDGAQHDEL
uniref:Protein OS-9 n=1 Tax=Tetraselmis sp. GSL018 TaxID=582737 RepID=A0A061RW13_9CHLO